MVIYHNIIIYTNILVLFPKLLSRGRYILYVVGVILSVALATIITRPLAAMLPVSKVPSPAVAQDPAVLTIIVLIIIVILKYLLLVAGTSFVLYFQKLIKEKRRTADLDQTLRSAQLGLLKNQINPHFLFNTLNNMIGIIEEEPEEMATKSLDELEDIVLYQYNCTNGKTVTLASEIQYIQSFLSLEKLRRDHFSFTVTQSINNDIRIEPLIFIPFVENAVKHNYSVVDSYVKVYFKLEKKVLYFRCVNSKPETEDAGKKGGLGLKNVQQRLQLMYPGKHTLEISPETNRFTVNLKIEL